MGQANSIDNNLEWRDLIMMTMGFSVLVAPLGGIPPLFGIAAAALWFGFSNINNDVRNPPVRKGKPDNTQRRAAFIGCLVVGVVASYVSPILLATLDVDVDDVGDVGIIAGVGLGVIMTAICLAFFINYGMVLGWWTPTGGLVTLLISIIPARIIGKNAGINIIVSFLVSSFVYALLVADNKNKKEPWMIGQSAYIGLMAGSAAALLLPTSSQIIKGLSEKAKGESEFALKVTEGGIQLMAVVMWFIYFIIWTLTFVPGALPYGWNALFNEGKTAELREKQEKEAKEAKRQKEIEEREAKRQKEIEERKAERQKKIEEREAERLRKEKEREAVRATREISSSIQSAFKRF
jgi:hypothetical protein